MLCMTVRTFNKKQQGLKVKKFILTGLLLATAMLVCGCGARLQQGLYDSGPYALLPGGHHKPVNRIVFSPSGKWMATAGYDRHVKLWDSQSLDLLADFHTHDRAVFGMAFSEDERLLAAADTGGTIRVRDLVSGNEIQVINASRKTLGRLEFMGDHRLAACGDDPIVRIWDVETGRQLQTLKHHSRPVLGLASGPGDRTLYSAGFDKLLIQWDLETGSLKNKWRLPAPVTDIAAPAGKNIIGAALMNKTAVLINPSNKETLCVLEGHKRPVTSVSFSDSGNTVLTSSQDGSLRLWDTASGELIKELKAPDADKVTYAAFHPTRPELAVSAEWFDRIRVWNLKKAALVQTIDALVSPVLSMKGGARTTVLAAGTQQTGVQVWTRQPEGRDASGLRLKHVIAHDKPVWCVAPHPIKPLIAYGTTEGEIMIWDMEKQEHTNGYLLPEAYLPSGIITGLKYSGDGELLAVRGAGGIFFLNTEKGGMAFRQKTVKGTSQSMAFHPEKDLLAMADGPRIKMITAWSEKKARWKEKTLARKRAAQVTAVDFSADGRYLASLDKKGNLNVWDPGLGEDGTVIFSWRMHGKDKKPLAGKTLVFCPDGRHVAAGTETGEILVYHLLESDPVAMVSGHRDGVNALEFSQEGKLLYSAGEDCLIRAWTMPGLNQLKSFTATRKGNKSACP